MKGIVVWAHGRGAALLLGAAFALALSGCGNSSSDARSKSDAKPRPPADSDTPGAAADGPYRALPPASLGRPLALAPPERDRALTEALQARNTERRARRWRAVHSGSDERAPSYLTRLALAMRSWVGTLDEDAAQGEAARRLERAYESAELLARNRLGPLLESVCASPSGERSGCLASVGMLLFERSNGEFGRCLATLVDASTQVGARTTGQLLLTADHCIEDQHVSGDELLPGEMFWIAPQIPGAQSAEWIAISRVIGRAPESYRPSRKEGNFVVGPLTPDYAWLELRRSSARPPSHLSASPLVSNEAVSVLGVSGGPSGFLAGSARIGLKRCRVIHSSLILPQLTAGDQAMALLRDCTVDPGDSGGPILRFDPQHSEREEVVGVIIGFTSADSEEFKPMREAWLQADAFTETPRTAAFVLGSNAFCIGRPGSTLASTPVPSSCDVDQLRTAGALAIPPTLNSAQIAPWVERYANEFPPAEWNWTRLVESDLPEAVRPVPACVEPAELTRSTRTYPLLLPMLDADYRPVPGLAPRASLHTQELFLAPAQGREHSTPVLYWLEQGKPVARYEAPLCPSSRRPLPLLR